MKKENYKKNQVMEISKMKQKQNEQTKKVKKLEQK